MATRAPVGYTPLDVRDWATKGYVDAAAMDTQFRGPIGYWQAPYGHIVGSTTGTAITSGRQSWAPLWVGQAMTVDQLAVYVATAQSGGTVTFRMGIFNSDSDGMPSTMISGASGLSSALTATGNATVTLTTPAVLTPGLYWISTLYVATSAPTTTPLFRIVSNTVYSMPQATLNVAAIGTPIRGYGITGRTDATFSNAFTYPPSTYIADTSLPLVYLHRSA